MTQFFSDGFESGDFSAWTGINGSPSLVSSPAHQGTNTMEITVKGAYIYKNITGISTVHVRVYWRLNGEIAAGSGSSQRIALMHLRPGANGYIVYVRNEGGLLQWGIRSLFGTTFWVWSTQQTPVIGTWYCVELAVVLNAGAGSATLYVNGSELTDITRSGLNNTGTITTVRVGQEDSSGNDYTAHWDDVVFSDNYIGPESAAGVLKEVVDGLSLSDVACCDKTLSVCDAVNMFDVLARNKPSLSVVDAVKLSDAPLADGCVLYLPMDEGDGTITYDKSGNGNNGTVNGAVWVDGKYGKALQFNGVDDYVDVPDDASLDLSWEITLMVWVKTSNGNKQSVIGKGGAYLLYVGTISGGKLNTYLYGTSPLEWKHGNVTIADGVWHHVAFTYKADGGENNYKLYVDGVLDVSFTVTGSIAVNPNRVGIGDRVDVGFRDFYNGLIDEPLIFNRALSPDEIWQLYSSTPTRILTNRVLPVADTINLADVLYANKTLHVIDAAIVADAIHTNKFNRITDALGLADTVKICKLIVLNESLTLAETVEAGVQRYRLLITIAGSKPLTTTVSMQKPMIIEATRQ